MTTAASAARGDPWTREALLPLYAPRSIAIVGASMRPGSFGARTLANLAAYDGRIHLVNARYDTIDGRPCHASVRVLPEVPDLVVITTPAPTVEEVLEDCIAAGVPAAIVYASGFAETGDPEDAARQDRLATRAAEAGLRLLGPNCVGMLDYVSGARVTFAGVPAGRVTEGPAIGLICQSGALGFALAQAMDRGVAFSHVLSCGNSADVDVADWISALADDPHCSVIACAFEGAPDPRRFLAAAERAWARDKPLVVFKLATGEEGAVAAMSHTGSLAGSHAAWTALFDRAGAIVVEDFDALVETAAFFAKAPAPDASGVAVLSGSGGAAIMAADCAETEGVALPQPSEAVRARLRAGLPPFVQPRNPVDATAQIINDMSALLDCADALLGDPAFGTLVFGYPYAYDTATARQPHLSALAARHGKPICLVWLTQLLEGPGTREAEADPNLVVFRSMRRCFRTLRAWHDRGARRRQPVRSALATYDRDRVRALFTDAGPGPLGEGPSKAILAACEIALPQGGRAADAAGAAELAERIAGPVAIKIDSPDIPHKTEAGGVMLGVTGPEAAAEAFQRVLTRCRAAAPGARITGVTVEEMIPPGVEVIIGIRDQEGFGPTVTVGLGGVFTELLRDTRTVLAPVDISEALAMLRGLRGARVFNGFRGAPPIDLVAVAGVVATLSQLAADSGGRLAEFEVNPLICLPDRAVAVDGMAVLAPPPAGKSAPARGGLRP